MSAARVATACEALLEKGAGAVRVAGPGSGALAAALGARGHRVARAAGAAAEAVVVSFLGARADPAARQAVLRDVARSLPPAGRLVLVDHNQPRDVVRRVVGTAALALRGLGPARARYPAARELRVLGFVVERLRLACGERVQLVAARRDQNSAYQGVARSDGLGITIW